MRDLRACGGGGGVGGGGGGGGGEVFFCTCTVQYFFSKKKAHHVLEGVKLFTLLSLTHITLRSAAYLFIMCAYGEGG